MAQYSAMQMLSSFSKPFILFQLYLLTIVHGFSCQKFVRVNSKWLFMSSWEATGLNQNDLMFKDECLIVNDRDGQSKRIIGAHKTGVIFALNKIF